MKIIIDTTSAAVVAAVQAAVQSIGEPGTLVAVIDESTPIAPTAHYTHKHEYVHGTCSCGSVSLSE